MTLTADGLLTSTALTGKFAFNGMSGPLDMSIAASFDEGPIAGTLNSTKIKRRGQARRVLGPGGEQEEGDLLGATATVTCSSADRRR